MADLSPIESEFATTDDAAAHDAWFRAKVQLALTSNAAMVPHDQVMADARAVLEEQRLAAARLAR